jgi:serine/threonine protein phosphatase 1
LRRRDKPAARHETIMSKTYAIGDVHGCLDQLQRLVELCRRDAGARSPAFIFLGDYIDRGADSRGVVDFLIALQDQSPDQVICLRGNHEDLLLAAREDGDQELNWLMNGGAATLDSYGGASPLDLPTEHIDWVYALPLFHDDGLRFFVHAGVHPARPLHRQNARDLLWIREPFLSSAREFGRLVVHGHTPTSNGAPDQRANRLNIDTGAVFGRALTAAVFNDQNVAPLKFLFAEPT